MTVRPLVQRVATLGAAGLTVLGTAACAGPRVGEVMGAPSVTTTVVQARVVASTPVVAQVSVPTQVCRDEWQQGAAQGSGAGALMGAIAGGAAGNAVGKGAGKALTTGVGIMAGAILGNQIETNGRPGTATPVRRCEQQAAYENRVVAYNVTYEFGGQRYSTQMTQEPGATIPLQVTLTPMVSSPTQSSGYVSQSNYWSAPPAVMYDDDDRWERPRGPRHWH